MKIDAQKDTAQRHFRLCTVSPTELLPYFRFPKTGLLLFSSNAAVINRSWRHSFLRMSENTAL